VRGDVPNDEEAAAPEGPSDAAGWSIEDFDDFAPVPELTDQEPDEHSPASEEQVSGDAAQADDPGSFQPGFEFTAMGRDEDAAIAQSAADEADSSEDPTTEEPGFAELWDSETSAKPAATEAAQEVESSRAATPATDPPVANEVDGAERSSDAGFDSDATAEFVPVGVEAATGSDASPPEAGDEEADDQTTGGAADESAGDEPTADEPEGDGVADNGTDGGTSAAVAAAGTAAAAVTATPESPASPPYDQELAEQQQLDEITSERLYATSTQEYADLAEHIAKAAGEDQELMAVAADMPGLERGVVSLDDVVEASGVDAAPVAVKRSSDLPLRVGTAVLLLAIFIGSLYRPLFLGLLALLVLGLAAWEFYTVLVRSGFNPLSMFGLVGVAAAMIGTWLFDPVAIPMSMAAALLLTLIFYTVVSGRSLPLFNAALTMMVAIWIAFGAFIFDMVQAPDFRWLIVALIVTVAFMDICQYFVGRKLGRTPLAPRISPKKTVEGLIGGIIGALFLGVAFGLFDNGPFDLGSGLLLGVIVAAIAPFGDLAISVVKRALEVKDMGTILPGHGGVLDRIDAMLFVVPVAWVAYAWLGLLS